MMKYTAIVIALLCCSGGFAQKPAPKPTPTKTPAAVPVKSSVAETDEFGRIEGQKYTNSVHGFQITFPDNWSVNDREFEAIVKPYGIDLSMVVPENFGGPGKVQMQRKFENVKVLLYAHHSISVANAGALVRLAVEDVRLNPVIKDAVDYFDLMRSQFALMKAPADFKYSETQAEKLGAKQFAFLDTSSKNGKKRLYATLRRGHVILFTMSYTKPEDLATMRQILAGGDFALQTK